MKRIWIMMFLTFLVWSAIGCTQPKEPEINRPEAPPEEKVTYFSRSVWIPASWIIDEKGDRQGVDLETLFQKVNKWVEENEDRIAVFSVDIVNATEDHPGDHDSIYTIVPSGALIVYTLKPK